jgi:CRP-like cAMP-binding protein
VAESLEPAEFAPGQRIIACGEEGDAFYILRSGRALVTSAAGEQLAVVDAGGHFGERALLRNDVREAHVTADPSQAQPALAYQLSREAFQAAMEAVEEAFRLHALLAGCPELSPLRPDARLAAANGMISRTLAAGEALIAKGEPMDGVILVAGGTLGVPDSADAHATGNLSPPWSRPGAAPLERGAAIGGESLLAAADGACAAPAALHAGAAGAQLLLLSRSRFAALFGGDSLASHIASTRCAALACVPLLKPLSGEAIAGLAAATQELQLLEGAAVFKAGEPGDAFYLIEAGSLAVLDGDGREVARLQEGGYFGELALISNENRRATVVVRGCAQASLLIMTRASFEAMREARTPPPSLRTLTDRARRSGVHARACALTRPRPAPAEQPGGGGRPGGGA